jgi:adenylylsulfate kinase
MNQTHLTWHDHTIQKADRIKAYAQKPFILWFTGLSGSGKSTLANLVETQLFQQGYKTYLLDGDNIRQGLNADLGFDEASRIENIRRIGEVAKLFVDGGIIVIAAFISPFEKDRQMVRNLVQKDEFIEIFVDAPLDICEQRDSKGLYAKARKGELKHFTGIDSPYESPVHPEIYIDASHTLSNNSHTIITYLIEHGFIHA